MNIIQNNDAIIKNMKLKQYEIKSNMKKKYASLCSNKSKHLDHVKELYEEYYKERQNNVDKTKIAIIKIKQLLESDNDEYHLNELRDLEKSLMNSD